MRRTSRSILLLIFLVLIAHAKAQDLELLEKEDAAVLEESGITPDAASKVEELDDLQALKEDVGETLFEPAKPESETVEALSETVDKVIPPDVKPLEKVEWGTNPPPVAEKKETPEIKDQKEKDLFGAEIISSSVDKIEVGKEERELLNLSKFIQNKIPAREWNEVALRANAERYVISQGEYLWKISQRLFGTGFYYSKIWSMNPHIQNPHEVTPGMVLVFHTGSSDEAPKVSLGDFGDLPPEAEELTVTENLSSGTPSEKVSVATPVSDSYVDVTRFGDVEDSAWPKERERLKKEGISFQYASEHTYDHLKASSEISLTDEYERYEPPASDVDQKVPTSNYDETGFDKSSIVTFDFKEGFYLNTFVTSNIVQDLGKIEATPNEPTLIGKYDTIFVQFDKSVKVRPGDMFSIYQSSGKVNHKNSDREGFRYTIIGQIKAIRMSGDKWECTVTDSTSLIQRGDRITVYTPKINRILKTFSHRNIEALIIDAYNETAQGLSYGDVVYLDRGRADGLELGNVLEVFGNRDRATDKRISIEPAYKIGEITVITLTDNFSTGLITNSSAEMGVGTLAITKTAEQVAKAKRVKSADGLKVIKEKELGALDELDVELNLDDRSLNLLKKSEEIKLTEGELEELEKQEREKSIIKDHEKDLQELERLEGELSQAEKEFQSEKLDEDKLLEEEDLDGVESKAKKQDKDGFESLDEIEKEIGQKYLDEDLNSKENPYGLTEFDLEEIDELLNTGNKK